MTSTKNISLRKLYSTSTGALMRQPTQKTLPGLPGQKIVGKRVGIMLELEWPLRRHCDVYAGVLQFAQECGNWDCYLDDFAEATLAQSSPNSRPYDGIIARATPSLAQVASKLGIPLVNVWYNSPVLKSLHGIFADPHAVGQSAAEHLLDRGHREFACLSYKGEKFQKLQVASFHQTLKARGYNCNCLCVESPFGTNLATYRRFQRSMSEWIKSWQTPTGVFCCFELGRYVADACRRLGVIIPDSAARRQRARSMRASFAVFDLR